MSLVPVCILSTFGAGDMELEDANNMHTYTGKQYAHIHTFGIGSGGDMGNLEVY